MLMQVALQNMLKMDHGDGGEMIQSAKDKVNIEQEETYTKKYLRYFLL